MTVGREDFNQTKPMNQQQKDEIIKVIKSDCKIKQKYIDNDCNTCAIGALALAAGCSQEQLKVAGSSFIGFYGDIILTLSTSITDKFGLSVDQQQAIQATNDDYTSPEERQAAILELLETFPVLC